MSYSHTMEKRLILTACIVSLNAIFVQSLDEQTGDGAVISEVKAAGNLRENLQNLFDSIATNDMKSGGIYRDVLRQEVAKGRQAFHAMKKELRIAQSKNSNRRRTFDENSDFGRTVSVIKRETKKRGRAKTTKISSLTTDESPTTSTTTEVFIPTDQTDLEDLYVNKFGDNITNFREWQPIREWYLEIDEPKLRKYCISAHKIAKKEELDVNVVVLRPRFLMFQRHNTKRVDMVAYGIANPEARNPDMLYWFTPEGKHWYITEGLTPNCVFYATIPNITLRAFQLVEHVCGIELPEESQLPKEVQPVEQGQPTEEGQKSRTINGDKD